ncbi:MAG: glycosyltransferase family 39 protein [Thermoanaerobaculia bacterium]
MESQSIRPRFVWPLVILLALAFQGSRGLWEPDEGRHASIAAAMLDSGDFRVPRLEGRVFLDKPPLVFWSAAAGIAAFGRNEWAVRLPLALFFVLAAVGVGRWGARLWSREVGERAAWIWATSLLPFLAGNSLTPDLPLACAAIWTAFGVVSAVRAERTRDRWLGWLGAGAAAGAGLLAKGPAMLATLPPLLAFALLDSRASRAELRSPRPWLAGSLALVLGGAWYLFVIRRLPGAAEYLVDNQVTGRLVSSAYQRNAGWQGALRVYAPTLLLGALPWWPWVAFRLARRPGSWSSKLAAWSRAARRPEWTLVGLGVALPFAVFALASSKLPFYLLPICAPLAIGFACLLDVDLWSPRRRLAMALGWCALLLGIKAAAAYASLGTTVRDSGRLADAIRASPAGALGIVVVDSQANGLPFYGFADFHTARSPQVPYPLFEPSPRLPDALARVGAEGRPHLMLTSADRADRLAARLATLGWTCSDPERYLRLVGRVCRQVGAPVSR